MKTVVLLAVLFSLPVFAQKKDIDKDRGAGSPIRIEAKRIENRIKRDLKSKLTFYVERMDPNFIHDDVQPMYKDMLARNLEQAILDSQWDTQGPCYEELEVIADDGTRRIERTRVPASAPERKPGGLICMDAMMLAEMNMGDMVHLVELAFHEHGHNFGYGEDDSNNLAAEIGDTFDEEKMTSLKYIPIPKFLPNFIKRNAKGELCSIAKELEVTLVFPKEQGWGAAIGYGGRTFATSDKAKQENIKTNFLKVVIKAENPLGNSLITWAWEVYDTEEPIILVLKDTVSKERYVQRFEKQRDLNYVFVPLDGNCNF